MNMPTRLGVDLTWPCGQTQDPVPNHYDPVYVEELERRVLMLEQFIRALYRVNHDDTSCPVNYDADGNRIPETEDMATAGGEEASLRSAMLGL